MIDYYHYYNFYGVYDDDHQLHSMDDDDDDDDDYQLSLLPCQIKKCLQLLDLFNIPVQASLNFV